MSDETFEVSRDTLELIYRSAFASGAATAFMSLKAAHGYKLTQETADEASHNAIGLAVLACDDDENRDRVWRGILAVMSGVMPPNGRVLDDAWAEMRSQLGESE